MFLIKRRDGGYPLFYKFAELFITDFNHALVIIPQLKKDGRLAANSQGASYESARFVSFQPEG